MSWINVHLRGREQHCGTTPLNARADTLLAASRLIITVNETAHKVQRIRPSSNAVASVAVIYSSPQSVNTLAGSVQFTIDARAHDNESLELLCTELEKACHENEEVKKSGVKIEKWDRFWTAGETIFDPRCVQFVRESAADAGLGFREMQSGAGHDSYVEINRCL